METIIRTVHNSSNPFVIINKNSLWDKDLSLEAIGLWTRLLSRPDNWQINVQELCKSCQCSDKRIYKLLKELIEKGYAYRSGGKDKNGKFTHTQYYVFETKVSKEEIQNILPLSQKPLSGFPLSGNWETTNINIVNTEEKREHALPSDPKKSPLPIHMDLSEMLYKAILKKNPTVLKPNMLSWSDEIRKMMNIDKRSSEDIKKIINYVFNNQFDEFWCTNILSPLKLRKHYSSIWGQMKKNEQKVLKVDPNQSLDKIKDQNRAWMKNIVDHLKPKTNRVLGLKINASYYYVDFYDKEKAVNKRLNYDIPRFQSECNKVLKQLDLI